MANHLQREIGFDAGADIGSTILEQRPAAILRLNAAKIARDLRLKFGGDRLGAVVPHQHIFGRNGGVGLELEDEMTVRPLQRAERLGGARD